MKLPKKFTERVGTHLKKYQTLSAAQKKRDISEADTVTLIKDFLSEVLGYDKFNELTSEYAIRNSRCDLAIKIAGKVKFLIEVKAIGKDLNSAHLDQVVGYGVNHGIGWVALTNSIEWQLYKIGFGKIEQVTAFSLTDLGSRKDEDLQKLFLLAREGTAKDAISTFYQQGQLFNRYTVAQMVMSDWVVTCLRRELRKLFPELKVDTATIQELLFNEIIKRDVVEGEKVKEAQQRIRRAANKLAKGSNKSEIGLKTAPVTTTEPTPLNNPLTVS